MSRLSDLQTFYGDIAQRHLRRIADAINDISSRSYTPTNLISDSLGTTLDVIAAVRYPLDLLKPVPPTVRFTIPQAATGAVEGISLNDPGTPLSTSGLASDFGNTIPVTSVGATMDANGDTLIVTLQGLSMPAVDLYHGSVRDSANKVVATIAVQVIP